jgi:hypothetical protein
VSGGKNTVMYKRLFTIIVLTVLVTSGCRRTGDDPQSARVSSANCERLKKAMINHDVDEARIAITEYIAALSTDVFSGATIDELIRLIEKNCIAIDADLVCVSCIDTLPAQSEITLRLTSAGTTMVKIIDLSYTPANKIRFVSMHN